MGNNHQPKTRNKTSLVGVFFLFVGIIAATNHAEAYSPDIANWAVQNQAKPTSIKAIQIGQTEKSPYAGRLRRMTKAEAEYDLEKLILPVKEHYLTAIAYDEALVGVGTASPELLDKIKHRVADPELNKRGIKELVSVGVSDYWGSSENRVHNLQKALFKYDNLIIKKGETFSFNAHLGAVTAKNGYKKSPILIEGVSREGLGGGVCQISTTIFRAGFFAGLPINERYPHSYALQTYHPHGLDSTIYPGQKDLKFTNNTAGDILVRVFDRDQRVFVFLYGTRDRNTTITPGQTTGSVEKGLRNIWHRSTTYHHEEITHNDDIKSRYKGLEKLEVVE